MKHLTDFMCDFFVAEQVTWRKKILIFYCQRCSKKYPTTVGFPTFLNLNTQHKLFIDKSVANNPQSTKHTYKIF